MAVPRAQGHKPTEGFLLRPCEDPSASDDEAQRRDKSQASTRHITCMPGGHQLGAPGCQALEVAAKQQALAALPLLGTHGDCHIM